MEPETRTEAAEAQTGEQRFSDSYEATLVAWLVARRHVLLGLYILIFGAFLVLFAAIDPSSVFEFAHGVFYWLRGDEEPWRDFPLIGRKSLDTRPSSGLFLIMLGIYLALQAAVLWGGGKIRLERPAAGFRKIGVALVVLSFFAVALTSGAVLLFVEFGQWDSGRAVGTLVEDGSWVYLVSGAWLFWFVTVWLYSRRRTQMGALARLLGIIFAGSWIEFALALPIDIAARNREDCYCAIGSWSVMLVTIPLMLWTIGPALYLLYLYERRLSAGEKGRALRILRDKTLLPSGRRKDA